MRNMFTWKSNYKLPISFIIFFVLMFFLIGEQLVALPIYLLGPGAGKDGPDKLHILDLGLSDSLHRPVAYLIIGTVIWILYRVFFWPIAWFVGAVLWILEQRTLTPLDQRPTLINTIIFTFTFWILLTLVPYFIYRWVDQKWGGKGVRGVILAALGINLLVLMFFVLQIYVLHNSYRGFHPNRGEQIDYTNRLPPNTCPERMIEEKDKPIVAYLNGKKLDVADKEQRWVEQNCPGVLEHP